MLELPTEVDNDRSEVDNDRSEVDNDRSEVDIIPAIFNQPIAGQFYHIRHPQLADLPALLRLEAACWPEPLRASTTELQQRIELFPSGHWVLEVNDQVVGVIYSQRIADVELLAHVTNLTVA